MLRRLDVLVVVISLLLCVTFTDGGTAHCPNGTFICADGSCVALAQICDGNPDCSDGSDETGCDVRQPRNCNKEVEFRCGGGECVPRSWKCDGEKDCPGGEDEQECSKSTRPRCHAEREFQCGSDKCIDLTWKCDGDADCNDGSDETPELCNGNSCDGFTCPNGTCIPQTRVCDGSIDCRDGTDEANCNNTLRPCAPGEMMCVEDNYCLKSVFFCDGINHCLSGGDEKNCRDVTRTSSSGCNGASCRVPSPSFPQLLVSYTNGMWRYDLSNNRDESVLPDILNMSIAAFDADVRRGVLYCWARSQNVAFSVDLKTKRRAQILTRGKIEGVAVDWVHGNLYTADTHGNGIVVSRLDGNNLKVLVDGNMDEPRGMAVDPYHGWFYWTDWGRNPKIEKCGMNGKERKAIVTTNLGWPNGIAIDYVEKRLYWVDAKMYVVATSDMDGGDRRLVLQDATILAHPFAVTLFEDFVYWTNWLDFSIYKVDKFGFGNATRIKSMANNVYDITVYDIKAQPVLLNHCGGDYGGCSHLCLPVPQNVSTGTVVRKFECACPDGMVLKDKTTCVDVAEKVTPSTTHRGHIQTETSTIITTETQSVPTESMTSFESSGTTRITGQDTAGTTGSPNTDLPLGTRLKDIWHKLRKTLLSSSANNTQAEITPGGEGGPPSPCTEGDLPCREAHFRVHINNKTMCCKDRKAISYTTSCGVNGEPHLICTCA